MRDEKSTVIERFKTGMSDRMPAAYVPERARHALALIEGLCAAASISLPWLSRQRPAFRNVVIPPTACLQERERPCFLTARALHPLWACALVCEGEAA